MTELEAQLRSVLKHSSLPEDPLSAARNAQHGDTRRMLNPARTRMAAVLLPFVEQQGQLQLWLTKRRADLRGHPGQISFPGGGYEAHDENLLATALRESQEEINLPAEQTEVIGYLDPYLTISNYCVVPVVARVAAEFSPVAQASEVAEVFSLSAGPLLDSQQQERRSVRINGMPASYYVVSCQGRVIWGATAGMLVNLSQKLA